MTDKEAIKYLQQLYPNGGHCWLDEQRIEAIGMAINALQEEPVSEELEKEIERYFKDWHFDYELDVAIKPDHYSASFDDIKDIARHFANWQREQLMKDAITACCFNFHNSEAVFSFKQPAENYLVGSELKVVIVKED